MSATDYAVGRILARLQKLTLREDQADELIRVIIERLEDRPKPRLIVVNTERDDE